MNLAEAQAYIAWLSNKTGKQYRLVSEAVREYAARGGNPGPFPFPFDEGKNYQISKHANTYGPTDGYTYTNPAKAFAPNAFGVYNMHGNVSEWVADCYHQTTSAPLLTAVPGSRRVVSCKAFAATTTLKHRSSRAPATATTCTPTRAATGWAFA